LWCFIGKWDEQRYFYFTLSVDSLSDKLDHILRLCEAETYTLRPGLDFLPVTRGSARKLIPPPPLPPLDKNDTAAKSASLSSTRACWFFQWLSLCLSFPGLRPPKALIEPRWIVREENVE